MDEIWNEIGGYEGFYRVSNCGRVYGVKNNHLMKLFQNDKVGYLVVRLSKDNVKRKHFVHRLVAAAFVPNPKDKPWVDHKNRNKSDNRAENLRWSNNNENAVNRKRELSESGYRGVYLISKNSYLAQITVNGKRIGLGYYDNPKTAAIAYNNAASNYHGEFAIFNQI